ncbi:unnamed protein product [Polarella glacialis]|uniref:Uncharacterized protein n=2 Tax=Polarella glacialis TaxID=89957 RepID=A0A813IFI2_POLGL|nr:unnamed protein product [Polarella glacialis]
MDEIQQSRQQPRGGGGGGVPAQQTAEKDTLAEEQVAMAPEASPLDQGPGEAALPTESYRDYLKDALEHRILFHTLFLSITMPNVLSQTTPRTGLDLAIAILTTLMALTNIFSTVWTIFASGMVGAVSHLNMKSWLQANAIFMQAALSSTCALVPMAMVTCVLSAVRA